MKYKLEIEIDGHAVKESGLDVESYIRQEMGWLEDSGMHLVGLQAQSASDLQRPSGALTETMGVGSTNKRLCELVDLVENNHDCVIFAVKPETKPMDLIRLSGFTGNEEMFRVSKNKDTISLTVFYRGGGSTSMSMGNSTTLVSENLRVVRTKVMECVKLDYGIVVGGSSIFDSKFSYWMERTCGERDLDSPREFYLINSPRGHSSLFVNGQHISLFDSFEAFERWAADASIDIHWASEYPAGNACIVYKGEFRRAGKNLNLDAQVAEARAVSQAVADREQEKPVRSKEVDHEK